LKAENSKFDFGNFGDEGYHHYAVNAGKHTKEEAIKIYEKERYNEAPYIVEQSHVKWRAGVNEDGKPCVGWWFDYYPTEKRSVLVWAFRYKSNK